MGRFDWGHDFEHEQFQARAHEDSLHEGSQQRARFDIHHVAGEKQLSGDTSKLFHFGNHVAGDEQLQELQHLSHTTSSVNFSNSPQPEPGEHGAPFCDWRHCSFHQPRAGHHDRLADAKFDHGHRQSQSTVLCQCSLAGLYLALCFS